MVAALVFTHTAKPKVKLDLFRPGSGNPFRVDSHTTMIVEFASRSGHPICTIFNHNSIQWKTLGFPPLLPPKLNLVHFNFKIMISGGNNSNDFPENQLIKIRAVYNLWKNAFKCSVPMIIKTLVVCPSKWQPITTWGQNRPPGAKIDGGSKHCREGWTP